MSIHDEHQPGPTSWNGATEEFRKIRIDYVERMGEKYLEIIQKQVEAIAKLLVLINSGGAAAVLAALAQKQDLFLKSTLRCFVMGIIAVALAMALSYYQYDFGSSRIVKGFEDHVAGKIDWIEYINSLRPPAWSGWARVVTLASPFFYWASFACFVTGCSLGARQI